MSREISQMEKKLQFSCARHHLAEMAALVYQQTSIVHGGHNVNSCSDLCALRNKLKTREGPDLGLESAVVKWTSNFLEESSQSSENLSHAFLMLYKLKSAKKNAIYYKPNLTDVQNAIDLQCSNSDCIFEKEKASVKLNFRKFAEKVCEVDQHDDNVFGNFLF